MAAKQKLKVNMISETVFTVRGHGVHTAFVEMTESLKRRDDVDVKVNTFRKADITHIQTVGVYSLFQLLFGRGKKVVSAHVVPDSFTGSLLGAKYWYPLAKWYLRFFYGRADRLLAVAQEVKDTMQSQLKIKKPIEVFPNTIDTSRYHTTAPERTKARKKLGVKEGQFAVVAVGQVQPRKRYDIFIELARQLPSMKFFWVGGVPFKRLGADFEAMDSLIKSAPKNVVTTGVIELEEVKQYYQASDAFILPSEQETMGIVVIEAAATGIPVIIRDIHDYDSSFGNNALRGTDKTFKSIIEKLSKNKKFYSEWVKKGAKIADKYDSTKGGQRLVEAYQKTLQ